MPTLEERVARLEQIAAPEETTQATYLTVDPSTGLIGASFTGVITALGLILPSGLSGVGDTNRIQWRDTLSDPSTQTAVEQVYFGVGGGGTERRESFLTRASNPAGGLNYRIMSYVSGAESSEIDINTKPGDNANTAILLSCAAGATASRKLLDAAGNSDFTQNSQGPFVRNNQNPVTVTSGGFTKSLLDAASNSDFLVLWQTGNHKVSFGSNTFVFSSSLTAASLNVNHGLPSAPVLVVATIIAGSTTTLICPYIQNSGATQITFTAASSVVLNGGINFYWLAIS